MARTTPTLVKKIVKVKAAHDLTPFIEGASQLVDDCCLEFDYSAEKLERIERWLAAHFYCIQYSRRLQEQVAGGTGQTVQSKVDLFLNLTHYGQMAQLFDTEGGLANLNNSMENKKVVATLVWLGKEDE